MNSQHKYYNALNIVCGGDYTEIKRTLAKSQNALKTLNKKSGVDAEKEWQRLEKLGASLILKEDDNYPDLLKQIPWPPFGIYTLGNINYPTPAIAIVGTRSATPQGKELSRYFANNLAAAGLPIISGLAMGIDEQAHHGTLEAGGKTIAVLGTPLNRLYPKQNERLALEILGKDGGIISEFPLTQEYHPQNFLIRNRIISGLTNGILVIEAPEKSGSLATAKFALEQNREVFVIPGNIGAKNYKGSNELIKAGATPVTSPDDILNYFNINITQQRKEKNNKTANPEEKAIIELLKNGDKLTAEQLWRNTKIEIASLNKNLAKLTVKGIIKESNGKYYL
ncbi:MAG: DNA-protecting protein DprA [Candidatus Harrisonbacteria bacterium]|nr:DNA-protecting protein DprA [Candidatus Harrisonbacteria bacterium]